MKTIAIISSYRYDISHIDDNRAWCTFYEVFCPETNSIFSIDEQTGFGENALAQFNVINTTPEIIAAYNIEKENVRKAEAKILFEKYSAEIDAYNKSMRPQEKGQIVEIMAGRRKGKVAKISWLGKGKQFGANTKSWYAKAYPKAAALISCLNHRPYSIPAANCDLIRVWPVDGSAPFYINIDKAKVIEGFRPIEITLDDCGKFNTSFLESFTRKWNNGYDYNTVA